MTPLTRKENYLNEIVGWGETAPEKPLTPEEFFFAAILGEAVQTPEPLSRYQIYLAKIAGRNISVPKPLTRLELFLAKACGMDIETPTPITREEIFWSNYTAIVEFEVEGVPPLTYKAIEGTLENYRIYGNTANGESVGDLVAEGEHAGEYKVPVTVEGKNLWNELYNEDRFLHYVPIKVKNGEFTLSTTTPNAGAPGGSPAANIFFLAGNVNSGVSSLSNGCWVTNPKTVQSIDGYVTIAYKATESFGEQCDPWNNETMLNEGSTPLPYEPYHAPVTTPIYLPEQIRKVGDEAEYLDYGEQKMHRIGADDIDVTLPALPTITGTNVLSVGTTVQPSKVYVKYKGDRQ